MALSALERAARKEQEERNKQNKNPAPTTTNVPTKSASALERAAAKEREQGVTLSSNRRTAGIIPASSKVQELRNTVQTRKYYTPPENFVSQQEYDTWRSTVRDDKSIQAAIDEIDKTIKAKKREQVLYNPSTYSNTGMPGAVPVGDKYIAMAQEIQELEKQRQLLNEELNYSKYFSYGDLAKNEDFATMSAAGDSKQGTTWWDRTFKDSETEKAYDYINNIGDYRDTLQSVADKFGSNGNAQLNAYEYVTDEERGIFNYIYNTQGEEAAAEYLNWLKESLNYKYGQDIAAGMDSDLERAAYGLVTGLDQFGGGVKQLFTDERLPTSARQYAGQAAREDLADAGPSIFGNSLGQTFYDALNVTGNMAPSILVSAVTGGLASGLGASAALASTVGGVAGSAALGSSAGGNAYNQALAEGKSKSEARTYGTLVGAAEGGLQYLLGGIGKLGGAASKNVLAKVAGIDNALGRIAATGAIKIGSEVAEEELQNFIEPALRTLIFNEAYDAPNFEELAYTAILTALTTGGMEGGSIISAGSKQNAQTGAQFRSYGDESVQAIIEEGLASDVNTESHQMALELQKMQEQGKEISDHKLGTLYEFNKEAIEAENLAQEQAEAKKVALSARDKNAAQTERIAGYGEYGSRAFMEIVENSNKSPDEVKVEFQAAYEAGLTDLPKKMASLISPVQVAAYDAGRQDAAMSAKKAEVKGVTVWSKGGGLIENEHTAKLDTQTRSTLNSMGKATGTKIIVEEIPVELNADGFYRDSAGAIHIDVNTEKPVMVVAKHELTHRMQSLSPKEYEQYRNYAVQIESAELGYGGLTLVERMQQDYFERSDGNVRLTAEEAMDEIAANFTEKILTDEKVLHDFVTEASKSEETRTMAQKFFDAVREFIQKIKAVFNGDKAKMDAAAKQEFGTTIEQLERAEQLWKETYTAATKAAQSAKNAPQTRSESDVQYKLKQVNGKSVVWIENSALTNKQLMSHTAVAEYIAQHIGEVYTIIESGQKVYIGKELPSEYTHSKYTDSLRKINPSILKAKNKAASDLGLLIETATNRRWEKTRHEESKDAKYGMYRYDSSFAFPVKDRAGNVMNVRAYDVELLIRNASDSKKYLYDIVNIKENTASAIDLQKRETRLATHRAASRGSASGDNVAQDGENVKFSLKEPVEETKDLLALHNKDERSILAALELGGLPMPSIAVVKAEAGHSNYGPISLVFNKSTIDPEADKRNKVYGGDAYTPTAPAVEYPVNYDVKRSFENKVESLSKKIADGIFSRYSIVSSVGVDSETVLNMDEVAEKLASDDTVRAAYLADQGKTLEPVMRDAPKQFDSFGNDVLQKYIDALGETKLIDMFYDIWRDDGDLALFSSVEGDDLQIIRDVLKDHWRNTRTFSGKTPTEEQLNKKAARLDEYRAAKFAANAWKYYIAGNNGRSGEPEVDRMATSDALREAVDYNDVKAWVLENIDGMLDAPGLRNNKDTFLPSGKRRSFWQTHDAYTLENIVKAMKENQKERGGQVWGVTPGVLQATTTPSYKSISQIKADSGRLGKVEGEEYTAQVQAVDEQLKAIIEKVKSSNKAHSENSFWESDIIGEVLMQTANGKKTVDAIMKSFQNEGYKISSQTAQDIQALYKAAAALPTEYFEAKPQRAVGFDEVLAAVIPDNSSKKLKDALAAKDVNVLTYKAGDETDRLAKVNSVDDAKFSLKGQSDLMKENAKLKEVNEALREQFKLTTFAKVDAKKLDSFTKQILKDYTSEADRDEIRGALDDLYGYMANGEEGQPPAWNEVQRRAYGVASSILRDASIINDDMYQEYKGLRDYLRNTGLKLDKKDEHDIGPYENLNEFRKANFGRIKITNNGLPVDTAYQELANMYPEFFDAEEHTHPGDQLAHIEEVLLSLEPYEVNPYKYNMRENATWLANDIIERFYDLPQAKPTFADKAEQKLTKQKIADGKKLERVREQKNERIAKLIAQQREKVNRVTATERKKRAEAVKKVKAHYSEKEARMSDRRKVSAFRNKINKHVANISKMLLNPTETSHVPEIMRPAVSEFLAVLDLTTERQGEKTINRLNALKNQYQKIADGKVDVDMEVDPDLLDNIEEVIASLGKNGEIAIEDLSSRQLETLYRVVLAVERSIYSYNRAMNENMKQTISELGHAAMIENSASKGYQESSVRPKQWAADILNMDMLNPQDFFMQTGDTMESLFNEIRKGFDTKIRNTAVAQDYMKELTKGVDMAKITGDKARVQEFKTGNGQTISLTPAQVMSLYLLERQKDAKDHIYVGGIKQAPTVALRGKGKRPQITRSYDVVHVTPEDVGKIISSMTDEQKAIAEGISKFFTDYTAQWGNEVSLKLYGYKKFTVENYFPIVSDRNYIADVFGETTDMTLKNMGSTKARQKGANNPVIIEDVFDVFTRQADQMSSYNAFVIPLGDMQRVFNFKTMDGSVKQSIEKRFGTRATRYFKQLMTDINGGARYNGGSEIANKLISNYKQAKLGLNLRVILQQPTAFIRAAAVMDSKYLAKAVTTKSSADMETIYKYAPIAQWKNWGFFSMDTGKRMKELIMDEKTLSDYTMWAAGKMDELTWKRLWVAAELEIRDKKPELEVGSEDYYEAVGERFGEVVDRTQVVDSVLHRSQIMRNPDGLVKMSVSFMNEPFKAYNMLRSAAVEARRNPGAASKKMLGMAVSGYLASVVVNHLITAAVDTLRGDEDDEEWLEKMVNKVLGKEDEDVEPKTWQQRYMWHFLDNLVNEPLSMLPYVKDVVSLWQGYDIKRMDMQGIGDLMNAATRAGSDKYSIGMKIADVGAKAADLFGIPASSFKREVETISKLVLNTVDSPWVDYQNAKLWNSIKSSKNKKVFLDILYKAYEQGDADTYKRIVKDMIANGFDAKSIESGMKSRAKTAGVSNDDLDGFAAGIGIKPSFAAEEETEEKFGIESMTGDQYIEFVDYRGDIVEQVVGDFQRRGLGSMDEETAEALYNAAYEYAQATALERASGGEYESDKAWIDKAQDAAEIGLTPSEYIMLGQEYSWQTIGADGVYDAYDAGVDVRTYLEFKDNMKHLEYESGVDGARKDAFTEMLNSMGLSQEDFDYLFSTEYKAEEKKKRSAFGAGTFGN